MNFYLHTLGCRLNTSEMETLARRLAAAGHRIVSSAEAADVCVVNTCAVTGEAARKSRQLARKLARLNPEARLALTGCYVTLAPEAVTNLPNVELVVDNAGKDRLADLLRPAVIPNGDGSGRLPAPGKLGPTEGPDLWQARQQPDTPLYQPTRTRAFVKVQDGCNNRCTFCIVTVARGDERSRPIADVVDEIRDLSAEGYQEAVLSGVHLGGYGSDRGTNLHALVAAILRDTDLPRLRLSSLEPWDLQPTFFDLWQQGDGRLCPHLHLPLQAGCDRTLKRMARRGRTGDFRRLVDAARARIADLVVTTDIIAGFPGESDADFAESLRFVEEMAFAHVHAFPYSAREGTPAARFGGQVPVAVRRQRVAAVQAVALRTGEQVRRRFLGNVRPILWEKATAPANGAGTAWTGLTDNYLRVWAIAPAGLDLENRITPGRLLAVHDDGLEAAITL